MTSEEYVTAVAALQEQHQLRDDQVASALAGILVTLCKRHGEDPHAFVTWALRRALDPAPRWVP